MFSQINIATVIIVFIVVFTSNAQDTIPPSQKLYVHNLPNGDGMALHQDRVFVEAQGVLKTSREKGQEAQILFTNASNWEGASNSSYIDGFVKSDHDNPFIFPIGNRGAFKPVACSNAKGVIAAYFSGDSSFDIEDSNAIALLKQSSYWVVKGDLPTRLTFTWNTSDNVSALTNNDSSKLKILGFDGEGWRVIESTIDNFVLDINTSEVNYLDTPSDLNRGSISTNNTIFPNVYTAYTLGILKDKIEVETKTVAQTERYVNALSDIDLTNYKKTKSIHFPFTESKITLFSKFMLKRLVLDLKGTNPRIRLIGHADFYGTDSFNYQLGLDRAYAVKDMLANLGLNAVKVDVVSNGESKLKQKCKHCSSKETLIDRRVDIYILQ